jgi:hypothetical protein
MTITFMGYIDQMRDIEVRARALNLSVRQVCLRAGVSYNNWWRWRTSPGSPRLVSWHEAVERMTAVLDAEQKRLADAPGVAS